MPHFDLTIRLGDFISLTVWAATIVLFFIRQRDFNNDVLRILGNVKEPLRNPAGLLGNMEQLDKRVTGIENVLPFVEKLRGQFSPASPARKDMV